MAGRHYRAAIACALRHGVARVVTGRSVAERVIDTPLADRAVSAIHPRDAGAISDADGQPAIRHGARAWLPRRSRLLPPSHCPPSTTAASGGLSTPEHPARRTGAGRLGTLRPSHDRLRASAIDGLRHGAELVAPDIPALLPRCPHGKLPARPCRGVRGL